MAKKIPNIRFKGFEGEWEERTLGSMGETYNGLSGKTKNDFGHGEAQFVTYMNVFSNPVASPDGIDHVEIDPSQNEVKKGDILFTTSSETPDEVGMSSVWMEDMPNTYLNSFCFGYRPHEPIDPYFAAYLMRSSKIRNDFYFLAQGISRFNISKQKAMDIETNIPMSDEQQKIGEFFQQLDELIGAKEQELEKLRQMKLALLDKMFPNEEEIAPPIRFKGFTEKWLKIRLRDMFDFSLPHYSHSRDQLNYNEGDVQNVHYGDILIRYGEVIRAESDSIPFITSERSDNYKNAKLLDGDIIFADTAEDETCGKAVEITNIGGRTIIAGLHTFVARPKKDFGSKYLGYFFNSNAFHNQLLPLMQGTKVLSVSKPSVEDTFIFFPLAIQEQRLIGDFFRSQDEAINSSKKEIAKLRTIKHACLQQMFA